jgi:phage FluMu protein Com
MTIEFRCGNCNSLLRTSDDKAGLRAKCPNCGTEVTTPSPQPAPVAEDFEEYEEPDEFSRYFGGGPSTYVKPKPRNEFSERRVPCPMCGEQIAAAARRCRHCGETIGGPPARPTPGYAPTAGSSVASLVLGIVGLLTFCFWFVGPPCSVLAIGLAVVGIRAARTGQYRGEGMAVAGLILGILGAALSAIVYGFIFAAFNGRF